MDEHTTSWVTSETRRRLIERVDELGISGYALCKASGVSRSAWHNFVHGRTHLSADSLSRACITLGIDPGSIWPTLDEMEREYTVRTYSPF